MTDDTFATIPLVPTAAAPAPVARIVPSTTQTIRISWMDWLEQFLVHETPAIEAGAQLLFGAGAALIPGGIGSFLVQELGPGIVKQVVDGVLKNFEGFLDNPALAVEIPSTNALGVMVANAINTTAPNFAAKAEEFLDSWIAAALGTALPSAPAGSTPIPGNNGKIGSR